MSIESVEEKLQEAYNQTLTHYLDTSSWCACSVTDSLAIYTKPSNTYKPISICQVLISSDPSKVIEFLSDLSNWDTWFKYKKVSKLLTSNEDYSVWFFSTRSFGTFLGRELTLASQRRSVANKSMLIMTSVKFAAKEKKFYNISAECYFYSFIAEPEGNNCNLTVLFHDNPRGMAALVHRKLSESFMKRMLVLKAILERL
jgi:hypothetical protein